MKKRRFNICVSLVAAMAAALMSVDATAGGPLVDVRSIDPTIMVELRYAGRNNLIGHALYPSETHALARPEVASALAVAQAVLRRYQYGLKNWDAHRPVAGDRPPLGTPSHNEHVCHHPNSSRV